MNIAADEVALRLTNSRVRNTDCLAVSHTLCRQLSCAELDGLIRVESRLLR